MTRRESKTSDGAQRLIGAKLEFPKPRAGLVARPHLIDMLDRGRDGRVALVSAPAGYGKTTLVAQWLDRDSSPAAAWLSLDRLDNDLERFARYVVAALHRVEEDCLEETEKILSARNLPPPQHLAESMVFELQKLGRRVALVLDDYGFIRAPAVHEFMGSLVPNLPSALHLVVISRIDPPLPLSLWRSRHWLHDLRVADLRFSREEAGAFFGAVNELRLSREGIDTIHRKTEGWIAGLRLALLSLAGEPDPEGRLRAFSASDRLVTDYLMEEVLTRQPPEIREFLAITSVLERFSPQLCDELLAGSNRESFGRSRGLLDRLYKQNLFLVSLGPVHGWYRYHQLFRQLLLERFDELMPATAQADILKRAGAWFCSKGWTEDGLKCFLAAGDLDEAADVIGNRLHDVIADDLSRRTLARWLEMFPSGAERTRLPLLVASAYMRSLRSDYEGVNHLLEEIDVACGDARGNRQTKWRRVFQKDLDFLQAFASFWKGDMERACECGSRILDQISSPMGFLGAFTIMYYGGSLALAGRWTEYLRFVESGTTQPGFSDSPQQLPFLVVKAVVHLYRGELAECRAVASRLTSGTDVAIPKYFEALGYYLLGAVAYERNQLDEAERHFLAVESRRFDGPGLAYHGAATGLAQIELARGNVGPAERQAALARAFAVESRSSMLVRASEAVERYLAVAAGKPLDAAASPPDPDFMQLSIIPPSHSWAWVQIHSPSFDTRQAAIGFIEAALHLAEAHGVRRRVIQLSALRALALDAQNRRDEAVSVLGATLQRGAALGFVRSFVDWGEGVRTLLHAVMEKSPDDGHVALVLDAFGAAFQQSHSHAKPQAHAASRPAGPRTAHLRDSAGPGAATSIDELTNRELDVLELLQRRLSNKEIASRLGISAVTVKMHTLNIYRKLGVRGRRQAVAVAIERGILAS